MLIFGQGRLGGILHKADKVYRKDGCNLNCDILKTKIILRSDICYKLSYSNSHL